MQARILGHLVVGLLLAVPSTQGQFSFATNADSTVTITGYFGSGGAVVIPGTISNLTVNSLGDDSFYGCTNVTSVTIPKSVTSIGNDAFSGATLTEVVIPNSVTNIGDGAFDECTNLISVIIPIGVTTIGEHTFYDCEGLTSVIMSNGVTCIGDTAFCRCTSLTKIVIPGSVTNIGFQAFSGSGLTNVTIPGNVANIGDSAFAYCDSLVSAAVLDGVASIGEEAFYECEGLTNLTIGNGTTYIGDAAFCLCTSLANIVIPGSVTNIGFQAFDSCFQMKSVTLGSGVANMEDYVFYDCASLANVYCLGNAPTVEWTVFSADPDVVGVLEDPAAVYYLPGTTGWSDFSYNAGLTTTLWDIAPTIAITSPTSDSYYATSGKSINLEGTASDTIGIVKVTWTNAQTGSAGAATGTTAWTATNISLAMAFGSNVITVTAYDAAGDQTAVTLIVIPINGSSLQVTLTPAAVAAAGAHWQIDGGTMLNSGVKAANLPLGKHIVSFNTVSGWATPASQTVSIKTKSVVKVTGIYTFNAQGIYNGLFADGDIDLVASGMLSGLTVTASGAYTGKLLIAGSTNAISGSFNPSGRATNHVGRHCRPPPPQMPSRPNLPAPLF